MLLSRAKGKVGEKYEELRLAMRQAPAIYTDDTGWRVGGKMAFLMGFDTDRATVYQVRFQHRNEEVREIHSSQYKGVMVSDRGKSYDAKEFDAVAKQKCIFHLMRSVTGVVKP